MLRKSVLSNVVCLVDLSRQEALAERAEGDEADPQLLERRQDVRFRLPPPQRVFALQRRDRLDRMRAADGLHAGLREAEVLHLALLDQVLHRPGDVLDRHVRVDAVLVEEVDGLDPEPLERASVTAWMCSGRLFSPRCRPVAVELEAELGGDHDLIAERARALRPPAPRS